MEDWKKQLKVDDLPSPYYDIANELGIEAAIKIEKIFKGQTIYFASFENCCSDTKKNLIREEFNGYNTKYLARKYGVSDRYVQIACKEKIEELSRKPLDGKIQMDL